MLKLTDWWSWKRYLISWLTPIIYLPFITYSDAPQSKCAYVVLIMVTYWFSEVIPMSITALIPVVLFPMLGIINSDIVSKCYFNSTLMVFLGSLIAATAVEKSNLHERIALKVILIFGTSPSKLLLGFMTTTAFLSMWISNLASVALMIPIVNAALEQLTRRKSISINPTTTENGGMFSINMEDKIKWQTSLHNRNPTQITSVGLTKKTSRKLRKGILLGICYAANIGGTGTLTGSSTNLVLNAIYKENPISFSHWFLFNLPCLMLCISFTYLFLKMFYVNIKKSKHNTKQNELQVYETIKIQYDQLGSLRFHEVAVLVLFILMLLLWFFRAPDYMRGWTSLFVKESNYINDSMPAIFVVVLFFLIPADPRNLKSSPMLLDWKSTQERVSWGVILLLGGGFAMAKACEKSGLSFWIGNKLALLSDLPHPLILVIMCLITMVMTELTSNTATCTILLPVIKQMSTAMGINPLSVMLPVTVSCSFAFMLPVASGTNAIIFEVGRMKNQDMLLPGLFVKIICLAVLLFTSNTWARFVLNLNAMPVIQTAINNHTIVA